MTDVFASAPERDIIAAIMAQAESKVKEIIETARATAHKEAANAAQAMEAAVADIRKDAERRAAQNTAKAIANARVEAKRILLRAREDAINTILSQAEAYVQAVRTDSARYRLALARLLLEGIVGINHEEVVVAVSVADKAALDGTLLDDLKKQTQEICGSEVAIDLTFADQDLGGGCTVRSVDGHVSIDNTFTRRFVEAKTQLKALIADELVKDDG